MASSALTTPSQRRSAAVRCQICGDTGLVAFEPRVACFGANPWQHQAPCTCPAGDQWQREFRAVSDPPRCECGKVAEYCLLSRPACRVCDLRLR